MRNDRRLAMALIVAVAAVQKAGSGSRQSATYPRVWMRPLLYRVLANLVVVGHLAFILFAVLGGFLVFKWKWCACIHVPAFLWAALIAFAGWVCPLTPLENWLRERGGATAYSSGFIEHYILPLLYPIALTRRLQIAVGLFVLGVNLWLYWWVLRRTRLY